MVVAFTHFRLALLNWLCGRRRLLSQGQADPGYNRVPLSIFSRGVIDQHAVHVSVGTVTAIVPGSAISNAGNSEEPWSHPLVLNAGGAVASSAEIQQARHCHGLELTGW